MSVNLIKHKLLVVILVLLAFVSQTVASMPVSCDDMKMTMSHSMDSGSMSSNAIDSESTTVADCCEHDCNCSIGLSISATLSSSAFIDSWALLSQKIEQYTNILLSHSLTSLYRPPII